MRRVQIPKFILFARENKAFDVLEQPTQSVPFFDEENNRWVNISPTYHRVGHDGSTQWHDRLRNTHEEVLSSACREIFENWIHLCTLGSMYWSVPFCDAVDQWQNMRP